jgi:Tol biopolymer transport system component
MRRFARCAVLAISAALGLPALLPPPADAQLFGQNKVQYRRYEWQSISADHFEVYFYPGLDSLAMRVLDLSEKTHEVLSQRMGHRLGRRVPIILYGSHNDFAQTNITPELIDAGTGGFTELLRNRVVLPFTGSYEDLRHVLVHELVHAMMFDLLYGGSMAAPLSRQGLFAVPLWFAEGMAEYFSLGMESNAEMFMRDGIIEGYLPPLYYSGGYLVYKQGQSALTYMTERYGEDRLRNLLQVMRRVRSFDRAFERSVGMSVEKFDEQWQTWLRKEYWPTFAQKESPEKFARRLTDHRRDQSNVNSAPAVSPQGDRIAYFSDRRQYTDVYVMSAFDGKVQRRVIRGERSVLFEAIPSFRGSLTWSPDGSRIGLVAKSAGYDVLYVVDANSGAIRKRITLPCEALYFPAWSPTADSVVVAGVKDGRTDLWMVAVADEKISRITDDAYDEKQPAWTPDGRSITFSSDRLAPVVLHPLRHQKGFGSYGLFTLSLVDGRVTRVLDTFGDDQWPAWSPDGRRLAFITDRNGAPNIFLYNLADSTFTQLTDVLGGVTSLSWSRENDRLVFSAFDRGGWDVFAVKEPLSLDAVVERLQRATPNAVLDPREALEPAAGEVVFLPPAAALGIPWPDSVTAEAADSARVAVPLEAPALELTGHVDTLRAALPEGEEPPPWEGLVAAAPDTVAKIVATIPLEDHGGPFALPDSVLGQEPVPYAVRMAPDYAGGGFYAATGFGLVGSTQLVFSDFLGDHNVYVATDVFTNSIEETNALAIYNYLPGRWDVGGGFFHFKNYFSSRVTQLGENLDSPKLFSDRSFGGLITASYPFDRFRRVEFNFTQMFVDRQFFDRNVFGSIVETEREFRSVTSPAVSLVGDNTLFGYYGPVNGVRYNITYAPSLGLLDNSLQYHTMTLDARRYWDLTRGYTFAVRSLTGISDGRDPQAFSVGGFSTLRGYKDFDLFGDRVVLMNAELRFPFIQQLGLVGPVPIGIFNLRGALFTDAGLVWNEGDPLRFTTVENGGRRLASPKLSFGTGIRTSVFFLIMKLDTAWTTDLDTVSRPRWHFSIGPEF